MYGIHFICVSALSNCGLLYTQTFDICSNRNRYSVPLQSYSSNEVSCFFLQAPFPPTPPIAFTPRPKLLIYRLHIAITIAVTVIRVGTPSLEVESFKMIDGCTLMVTSTLVPL